MLQIVGGRADNRCLAGGARGGVDAGNLTARHGEQAVGIVIAHILLQDKGELRDVFERFQVARLDAGFLKRLLVERNVVVCVLYAPFHALKLQVAQLLTWHRLNFRLEVHLSLTFLCARRLACGKTYRRLDMKLPRRRLRPFDHHFVHGIVHRREQVLTHDVSSSVFDRARDLDGGTIGAARFHVAGSRGQRIVDLRG